mmetsp:Transcript_75997/g.211099  ORF Transcript_75997/g.211099 Transcript_75997/m.211099 type:complete len:926 (+) Transcript_75997:130-2907(+)
MSLRSPGMEKRSCGFTRSGMNDDDVVRFGSKFAISTSPGSSPRLHWKRPESKVLQATVSWVRAVWQPLLAAVYIYVTVAGTVWQLWLWRTAEDMEVTASVRVAVAATEVLPAKPVTVPPPETRPPVSSGSGGAPELAQRRPASSQDTHPIELKGEVLSAAWAWATEGTTGIVGDQRMHDVKGFAPQPLRVHGFILSQLEAFELHLRDGSQVRARDCQLAARSQPSGEVGKPGAVALSTAEAVVLHCPNDLEVQWSVAFLRLSSGAEVLRTRLVFDGASTAGSKMAADVESLVLWSLQAALCSGGNATDNDAAVATGGGGAERTAGQHTERTACFTTASTVAGGKSGDGSQTSNDGASVSASRAAGADAPRLADGGGGVSGGEVQGSPLVSMAAGAWLAFEHPRSTYAVHAGTVLKVMLDAPSPGTPYLASFGVSQQERASAAVDDEDSFLLLRRHFHAYLDVVRAAAYRANLHYSTWYDLRRTPCVDSSTLGYAACSAAHPLNRQIVEERLRAIHHQLSVVRGVPLDGFLLDDGWDDPALAPWEAEARNFPGGGLAPLSAMAASLGVNVGVWMSPWGGFRESGKRRLRYLAAFRNAESKDAGNSGLAPRLSGESYYAWFRNLTRELALKAGVRFFKFDGFADGLGVKGASRPMAGEVDALLRLTAELRQDSPAVYRPFWVTASTGAWPSPWWLLAADVIWRDGPDLGKEGAGSPRQQWITFRDSMVYKRVVQRAPLFPISSLALGGVIWSRAEEAGAYLNSFDVDDFRSEVRSFFLTGAALQDLHVQPELLTPEHWDIFADAVNVSKHYADVLRDSHWVGGDPSALEPYAYGAFACPPCKGLLSWRNPQGTGQNVTFTLRRALALPRGWRGGAAGAMWQVRQLWRSEAPGAILEQDSLALDTPLTLPLGGFELRAYEVFMATSLA